MLQDAAIGGPIMQVFVLGIDANLFVETLVFGRQHFYRIDTSNFREHIDSPVADGSFHVAPSRYRTWIRFGLCVGDVCDKTGDSRFS